MTTRVLVRNEVCLHAQDCEVSAVRRTMITMFPSNTLILYALILIVMNFATTTAFFQGGIVKLKRDHNDVASADPWQRRVRLSMSGTDDHDILLRVARGQQAERAPVWLMRQVCH